MRNLAGAVGLLLLIGCNEVPRTQVRTAEDVIDRSPKTTFQSQFTGDAVLDGARLTVRVEPVCSLVEMETVRTTTYYEKQDIPEDEKIWMGLLGGAAAAPIAGGAVILADAPKVYESDLNGRLYNPTGPDSAIAGGVALVLLGAALATPPIVNAFRYVGGESEAGTPFERPGQTLRSGVACGGAAGRPGFALTLRASGQQIPLGGGAGFEKRIIDLKPLIPDALLDAIPAPVSAAIYANESFLADVRAVELLEQLRKERTERDESSWKAAEPGACERGRSEQACAGVRRYVASLPSGRHVVEASALLARIAPAPAPAPQPPGGPVMADDPVKAKLEAAKKAAAEAAARAAAAAEKKRLDEEALRAKKAAEASQKSAKQACAAACAEACGKDAACKQSCQKETCQ
ncbi:MAG: hypothetical protein JNL21_27835 [Myxococcales bacterium]|nr:hypothetical protein [Myxococcales bacterium]